MESDGIESPLISKVFHNDVDNNRPSSSTSKSNIRNDQETSVSDSSSEGNSPIEHVALTDVGTLACVLLSFLNQFFWYRKEPLSITSISAQIAVVPLGHLMASTITDRNILITIFANSGAGNVYAVLVVTAVKIFYKKNLTFLVSLIIVITTQVLGFGWAGIFRRYLVEPATMWWPHNLVQVSLFRSLHEKENRGRSNSGRGRGLTRNQFFLIALVCSFAYYLLPGYLFPMLTSLSWICWIFPNSILAQQIGSGLHGLGVGAIGLDWSSISSYLGSPLASPWFATANIAVGFVVVMYVMNPITYWLNIYDAKTFPIFSDGLFSSTGQKYNITAVVDSNFRLDVDAYERIGPLRISTSFAMTYGISFVCLTSTIVHVLLFHGSEIWGLTKGAMQEKNVDVHTRIMRRYKQVPEWWFGCILLVNIIATIVAFQYYKEQLQFPWWAVLLACALAFFFTLPIGVIRATTNQSPALSVILEYIIGYTYPERPVANMCFKGIGASSMQQGLAFLEDFKLGHYMKIPPRTMFMAQVVGTLVSAVVHLGTAWWIMETVPDICDRALLPAGSPWTCPSDHLFYDASVIWGLVGPRRIFGDLGSYLAINWFFLAGAVAPLLVWLAHKSFPSQQWIRLITMPVLLDGMVNMPPATAVNYTSWIVVAFLSGYVAYRYHRNWWKRHNYILSGALDACLAFMAVLLHAFLGSNHIRLDWWGGSSDGCSFASCPTAPGIFVDHLIWNLMFNVEISKP
ncbi:hypothetical protein MKW98_001797 [Papaver atlanticum]|uniref:Oligopeptide transporter n=1 Tax=Papaver atlanticum TaxID=357466 RepID=A0AAD4S9R8_9MAGN|nr:hypothetical protein MKW98_001797 [Papaver atlanticum]